MARERARVRPGKDVDVEDEMEKGPSPALIVIIAMVMAVLIISGIYFIFFRGRAEFGDIQVGEISGTDLDRDGYPEAWLIEAYATPGGYSEANGDASMKIFFENETIPVFRTSIDFRNGLGSVEVKRSDFVIGNGDYTIEISKGSVKSEKVERIGDVVEDISVQWWVENVNDPMGEIRESEVHLLLQPDRSNNGTLDIAGAFPPFELNATVTDPHGNSHKIGHTGLSGLNSQMTMDLHHTKKGAYALSGTWTNIFVKHGSPFRLIPFTRNTTYEADAEPYADAGPDISVNMTGGGVEIAFDGAASWDDDRIVEYRWYFGDEEGDDGPAISSSSYITHTYNSNGTFYARLIVVDSSGQTSENRWGGFSKVEIRDE